MKRNGVYIIAEAGVNHNGSIDMALGLIDAAAEAGADAVKFQTFRADKLVSRIAPKAEYQQRATGTADSQLDMIRKLELSEEAHGLLVSHCAKRNIEFLSTPFDLESLDLLANRLDLSRIKISSGEITNIPFLLETARTGKPVILSTGMSTLGDIETALGALAFGYTESGIPSTIKAFGEAYASSAGQGVIRDKVTLLHCTTEYPALFADVNLLAMGTLESAFGLSVGYSDHTEGISVPVAAVALGAAVIEKHFTLDRNLPGPDHKASLEPEALKLMIRSIREVESALGSPVKKITPSEMKNSPVARKSLVASRDIRKGEPFTKENLAIKRPGDGIPPIHYWEWLGKVSDRDYLEGERIRS